MMISRVRNGVLAGDYAALRAALESPVPTVIADWPAFVLPDDLPPDADFPTPTSEAELTELLEMLPHGQRVVAALTAAEMAVAWRAMREANTHASVTALLALVWRWVDAEISGDELRLAEVEWRAAGAAWAAFRWDENLRVGDDISSLAAYQLIPTVTTSAHAYPAALAVSIAADACLPTAVVTAMERATWEGMRSSAPVRENRRRFYARWWLRCRRRMAWESVLIASIR